MKSKIHHLKQLELKTFQDQREGSISSIFYASLVLHGKAVYLITKHVMKR